MNAAHLHLLVNHLPIIGAFLAVPLLALALIRRQELSGLRGAVLVLAMAAVGAGLAQSTGEEAEERVEDAGWASERLMHAHEERAEIATPIAILTALLGVGVLVWTERKRAVNPALVAGLGLMATVSAGTLAWVGASGGEIRHDEIRDPTASALSEAGGGAGGEAGGEAGAEAGEHDKEEGEEDED